METFVHPYIQKHETCTWWGGWENQRNARHHMYHSYVCAESSLLWCLCPFCLCYFGLGQRPQKHHLYGGNSHLHEMGSFFHILHQTCRIWLPQQPQQSHSRCHILNWTERQFVSSLNRKRGLSSVNSYLLSNSVEEKRLLDPLVYFGKKISDVPFVAFFWWKQIQLLVLTEW